MHPRAALIASPLSAFNPFLYTSVGEDKNGMALTVLSALARHSVDPWEQAATLSRLPRESARVELVGRLRLLAGRASLEDCIEIADRLLPLLPRPGFFIGAVAQPLLPGGRLPGRSDVTAMLMYFVAVLLGLWLSSAMAPTPEDQRIAENSAEGAGQPANLASRQRNP